MHFVSMKEQVVRDIKPFPLTLEGSHQTRPPPLPRRRDLHRRARSVSRAYDRYKVPRDRGRAAGGAPRLFRRRHPLLARAARDFRPILQRVGRHGRRHPDEQPPAGATTTSATPSSPATARTPSGPTDPDGTLAFTRNLLYSDKLAEVPLPPGAMRQLLDQAHRCPLLRRDAGRPHGNRGRHCPRLARQRPGRAAERLSLRRPALVECGDRRHRAFHRQQDPACAARMARCRLPPAGAQLRRLVSLQSPRLGRPPAGGARGAQRVAHRRAARCAPATG